MRQRFVALSSTCLGLTYHRTKVFVALLRPSEAVRTLVLNCAILGIFALLIFYSGGGLTIAPCAYPFLGLPLCGEWADYPEGLVGFPSLTVSLLYHRFRLLSTGF